MNVLEVENKALRKNLRLKVIVLIGIVVISAYVFWNFALPLLGKYEKLAILSHYWSVNSQGQVRQLVVYFQNNGTQDLTIGEIWIDEVLVNAANWECWAGSRLESKSTTTFYTASEDLRFEKGQNYNFTVVTSSKNHFSFSIRVDEVSMKEENVSISVSFYHWPPPTFDTPRVEIKVDNLGGTDVIVKHVFIDGALYEMEENPWISSVEGYALFHTTFEWVNQIEHHIRVETAVGNSYETVATPDWN